MIDLRYVVSTDFVPINETSGTVQNTSKINVVEISDSQTANSGILLYPMDKHSFNTQVYARCVDSGGAELRVVPFEVAAAEGGGNAISGGGISSIDLSDYVEKVAGKQLSTEDYTTAEKAKLSSIEAGAQANILEYIKVDGTALNITAKTVDIDLSGYVEKVNGKQLSTEDYTTAEKTKLGGIETGAQVNVIESITIDGTTQTITGSKAVALDLGDYAKKADVAAAIKVKGTVANFASLPANAEDGDMYNITAAGGTDKNGVAIKAGDNVVKTSTGWDNFGGTVDLSDYVEKVAGATQGNFAIFNAGGGIVDSSLDADNLVPATVAGDGVKFLRGDRTWATPTIEPFTIDSVSSTVEGSMWITDWDAPILAITLGSASSTVEGSMWIVDY